MLTYVNVEVRTGTLIFNPQGLTLILKSRLNIKVPPKY